MIKNNEINKQDFHGNLFFSSNSIGFEILEETILNSIFGGNDSGEDDDEYTDPTGHN